MKRRRRSRMERRRKSKTEKKGRSRMERRRRSSGIGGEDQGWKEENIKNRAEEKIKGRG